MPVSVVVGGQFGSEGKGKVAHYIARRMKASAVVRVGGTNSGHTVVDIRGDTHSLRQLPASVLAPDTTAILPAGAIIDPDILLDEIRRLGLGPDRVVVSPLATLISAEDKQTERQAGLIDRLGSTGSGTGAAFARRIARGDGTTLAGSDERLRSYLGDTTALMRGMLKRSERIVIEGSQGFGLSLLHGAEYPKATSRDTTAASFVGEAGLSPRDVDDVTLVIRCHPIRVAGNSGHLEHETTWRAIADRAMLPADFVELTTATKKVRRVGEFETAVVERAIAANYPNRIVLNHVDYLDPAARRGEFRPVVLDFIEHVVEGPLGVRVDWLGTSPADLVEDWRSRASGEK